MNPSAKSKKKKIKNENKLKVFLANPCKPKCPRLEESDLQQLKQLLSKAIQKSNKNQREFATASHIALGLESTLRIINKGKAGCVFLSTSIKPRYLLGLIARNVQVKNDTAPTFAQPQLEEFTSNIFGVSCLSLVLPKDEMLGTNLYKWILAHQICKSKDKNERVKAVKKRKVTLPSLAPVNQVKSLSENLLPSKDQEEEKLPIKRWGSDYISFSKTQTRMGVDEQVERDKDNLLDTLGKMKNKVTKQIQLSESVEENSKTSSEEVQLECEQLKESDHDDFLSDYMPLTIHKICPNPNRKPKKKRKKNKN